MNDLKFALRQLRKNPGFTAVAVLTLALGIGATTAMFSVIYGVLLYPYPYARPQEIWTPGLQSPAANQRMRSYGLDEFLEMARQPAFSEVMATAPGSMLLTGEFAPENLRAVRLSANAFQFLGVPALLGRTLGPSDVSAGGEPLPVAVLSFRCWQRLFAGSSSALGKTLRLDDELYTVIGVMPPRFGWWTDDGLWIPMATDSNGPERVFPIVRLKRGISSEVAREQLDVLHREFAKANPDRFPKDAFVTRLTNYLDITQASGEMQQSLRLLFGAVVFLLLIGCANVANLQLAKASSRAREMAIRLSIGAARSRLIRQLLTESVLVSLLGGLLGLVFTFWITRLMVAFMPSFLIPNEARIEVNGYILCFCLAISVFTGILFGLAPAVQSSGSNLFDALRDESLGSSALKGGKTRAGLVIVEVALSVVLLVCAGMTIRSFAALQQVRLGFQPEQVMTLDYTLPPKRYASWERRNQFAQELLDRVRNVPGVSAATIGNGGLPFGGAPSAFAIEGKVEAESLPILIQLVGADYLAAMGIPLRRGRMLSEREISLAQPVGIINEAAARLWPAGIDPVGRRLRLELLDKPFRPPVVAPTNASPYVTVVGIAGDTLNSDLRRDPQPAVLIPFTRIAPPDRTLAVRTRADPKALMNSIRAQVAAMDKEQPVDGPTLVKAMLAFQRAQPRFIMALFTLFASLGLTLAMLGIYSVLSYTVSRRTREIGVRLALGAGQADILRLIFQLGGKLVAVGLLVGLAASFAASRLLASQLVLFQVTSNDAATFLGVLALLSVVAAAACLVPARRAAKIDPMESLRHE